MVLSVILFGIIGSFVWDRDLAYVASSPQDLPPAWVTTGSRFPGEAAHPLGTDNQGRDILAVLIAGAPGSLQVGFTAAVVGLLIGIILGTIAGYFGGKPDAIIRTLADFIMTVPTLAILIVISSYVRVVDLGTMSLILGMMA